jgi:hypothetical protein
MTNQYLDAANNKKAPWILKPVFKPERSDQPRMVLKSTKPSLLRFNIEKKIML